MAEAQLAITGLVKRFGGLAATDDLSLAVERGEIHALIGPNGAGKSTLISQIAGELKQDAGTIVFEGEDISSAPPHARVKRGLVRTFQITQLLKEDTALENVSLAVQVGEGHSYRFWSQARHQRALVEPALAHLCEVGLEPRAHVRVGDMSHGEHKQLELAIALALRPRLLLLDEPMAGLGPSETVEMIEALRRLKERTTLLIVEHDMDAVFALADRISVLVYGRCIASGGPDAIRANPDVQQAYLGEEHA